MVLKHLTYSLEKNKSEMVLFVEKNLLNTSCWPVSDKYYKPKSLHYKPINSFSLITILQPFSRKTQTRERGGFIRSFLIFLSKDDNV